MRKFILLSFLLLSSVPALADDLSLGEVGKRFPSFQMELAKAMQTKGVVCNLEFTFPLDPGLGTPQSSYGIGEIDNLRKYFADFYRDLDHLSRQVAFCYSTQEALDRDSKKLDRALDKRKIKIPAVEATAILDVTYFWGKDDINASDTDPVQVRNLSIR